MADGSAHIAILDDDASVRKALIRLFEVTRYKARSYASAVEFLGAFNPRDAPECLVADFHMPNMNAIELQHHLNDVGVRIPMIVVTAFDEPQLRSLCIAAGVSAYFGKPIRKHVLMAAIDDAVGAKGRAQ